jgi:chemotaxis protein methyltransferase CheR
VQDSACIELLRWALPRLGLRWAGFRKPRGQVCKRIARRLRELGLSEPAAYRDYLGRHPEEWRVLEARCRVVVSRFLRDRAVFFLLGEAVLPRLARDAQARGERRLRCWSAGCASGEEPYSVMLVWHQQVAPRFPGMRLEVVGSDADPVLLARARAAVYPESSVREVPAEWREQAFVREGDAFRLRPPYRAHVELLEADIRGAPPPGSFVLVLCRNLVLTYFDPTRQREAMERILPVLRTGGALVVGAHETLPAGMPGLTPWFGSRPIYRWSRED